MPSPRNPAVALSALLLLGCRGPQGPVAAPAPDRGVDAVGPDAAPRACLLPFPEPTGHWVTWQELPLVIGFGRRKLALTPARPGLLFFSGAGQHVFAAKADGTIVADLDAVPTNTSLMFDPKEPEVLYVGGLALYRRKVP